MTWATGEANKEKAVYSTAAPRMKALSFQLVPSGRGLPAAGRTAVGVTAGLDLDLQSEFSMTSDAGVKFKPVTIQTQKGRYLEVRAFAAEDFGALVQMYKEFEPKRVAQGLPPPDVPRIAHWLDRLAQKSHSLLAWEGGKVVAHTILCPMPAAAVEFTIFVHQNYREEGLGTVLSRHTLEWATDMEFSRAYLTTEVSNFRALRLFRKLGFQIISSGGDEVEMKLDLTSIDDERPKAA